MADEASATAEGEAVENIPVPTNPQVLKTSDEILSELFGAFNATPPPLDDLKVLDTKNIVVDKNHKKHKKHSKKKHKKVKKKKKRSSSSDSTESKEIKKKSCKKLKKRGSKDLTSSSSSVKKKKKKLGKFSASDDTESDAEEPLRKKLKSDNGDKSSNETKLVSVKVKEENVNIKTPQVNGKSTLSTVPEVIRENILKQAVSKIVDKVIRSTDLASEISKSINGVKSSSNSSDNSMSTVDNETKYLSKTIKQEPKDDKTSKSIVTESVVTKDDIMKKPLEGNNFAEKCHEKSKGSEAVKTLPVADVFVEDLIDCGVKKDDLHPNLDKPKQNSGKIKIPNLKFSQVYEATVKQIEEEAKLKAEKYEEGEISESSEEARSPTPSDLSSSGSIGGDVKKSEGKKKHHHHHRHHRHHHRHSHHRSRSLDKHRSHSHGERSHSSHHHRDGRDTHRERDREKRRSRERETSRGREKEKDRGRDGKRSRDRTKDRSRSRDCLKDKGRSRSRSRGRHRSRSKSKDHTKTGIINRSRSRDKKTKERDRSKERRRSRDKDVRRQKTHSHEREKRNSEEKIDKQKLLEIARKNALNMLKNPSGTADQTKLAITSGGKTVNELTDFCKLLSKKDADGHESISSNTSGDESESEKPFHHPFQIKDRPSSIVLNIRNSVALPVKSLQEKAAEQSRQLRLQFPVSSGQQHRKTESDWIPVSPKRPETPPTTQVALVKPTTKRVFTDPPPKPDLDIGSIVSQRLDAIRRLQENPTDTDALSKMQVAQQHMQTWAESKQLPPGQFTGTTGVKVLSQAELASGYQAWARRDQLQVAAPVNNGVGMTLLQKMGWRPGEGLGKNKEGTLQPLLLEVKMDKKGLVAQEELPVRQPHQIIRGKPRSLEGKHPVSLLNEYCSRRKLGPPFFELVDEAGPDHKKNFLFKVRVNGVEYKPAVGSPKKKQARAEAAEVCLKALNILPNK